MGAKIEEDKDGNKLESKRLHGGGEPEENAGGRENKENCVQQKSGRHGSSIIHKP